MGRFPRPLFPCVALLMTLCGVPALAGDVEFSASSAFLSNYVWRGQRLSEGFVGQESATVGYKGFSATFWSNYDFEGTRWSEVDLTLAYAWELGPLTLEAGYNYMGFFDQRSQELYVSGSLDTVLNPTLAVYVDVDAGKGGFLQAAVSHSFKLPRDATFDVGANVGFNLDNAYMGLDPSDEKFAGPYNAELQVGFTFPLGKGFSLVPTAACSIPLGDRAKHAIGAASVNGHSTTVYGGVTLNWEKEGPRQ
ncbi:MAG: hypothetical protein KA419_10990 [Acidobacteria bacterium]|nr:hypothetical protein [Acidobacteriota bacterium]